MRAASIAICVILGAGALAPAAARGELFLLKSGGQVEGELLNPGRGRDDKYTVRTGPGVLLSLEAGQVARMVVVSELEQQYQTLLPSVPNTLEGHFDMAKWCLDSGLTAQRQFHLEQVLKFDPDHEAARLALGYAKHGSQWLKPDEYMQKQGYVRYRGAWRLKQDVELESRNTSQELAAKEWRQKIKMWRGWLGKKRDTEARRHIAAIKDPAAVPALVELIADTSESRELRQDCLELLERIPGGAPTSVLIKLALTDKDQGLRDRALDELRNRRSPEALAAFVKELRSKDNRVVNRAALCLDRLENKEATIPLIEALITEHKYIIQTGSGNPGGIGASFNGTDGGGGGSFSQGSKQQVIKQKHQNEMVLAALTHLHGGVNHGYSSDAWKRWYVETQATTNVDLRRGE
jgi:hypothetical protein